MFSINEKVVCIKSFLYDEEDIDIGNKLPVKGEMYTIRDISEDEKGSIYFKFYELINPVVNYSNGTRESEFWSERFRKLDHSFAENLLAELIEEHKEEELCITI